MSKKAKIGAVLVAVAVVVVVATAGSPVAYSQTAAPAWAPAKAADMPVAVSAVAQTLSANEEEDTFTFKLDNLTAFRVDRVVTVARVFSSNGRPRGLFSGEAPVAIAPHGSAQVTLTTRHGLVRPDSQIVVLVARVQYRDDVGDWAWHVDPSELVRITPTAEALLDSSTRRLQAPEPHLVAAGRRENP